MNVDKNAAYPKPLRSSKSLEYFPMVARRSSLDEFRLAIAGGNGHIDTLSTTLTGFGRHARYASEQATELKDADTAAISPTLHEASTNGSGSSRRASTQAVEKGGTLHGRSGKVRHRWSFNVWVTLGLTLHVYP